MFEGSPVELPAAQTENLFDAALFASTPLLNVLVDGDVKARNMSVAQASMKVAIKTKMIKNIFVASINNASLPVAN